jgi:DNA-binding XRE family transcriptional regulator
MTSARRQQERERAAARSRHPALGHAIDLDLMRRREAQRMSEAGHPWPDEAALLIAARGRLGLDRDRFADVVGVPEPTIARIEDGSTDVE